MSYLDQDMADLQARHDAAQEAMIKKYSLQDVLAMVEDQDITVSGTVADTMGLVKAIFSKCPVFCEFTLHYYDYSADGDITLSLVMGEHGELKSYSFWDEERNLTEMPDPYNIAADTLSDVDNTIPEIKVRIEQFEAYILSLKQQSQKRLDAQAQEAGYADRAAFEADVNAWMKTQ